jgi:uncharacterized protein
MSEYLPRTIDSELLEWSTSPARKPLILRGARQTGKSSSIRHLGATCFDLFLEVNLERREDLRMARACGSADELLEVLAARRSIERFPERTLLFLDEIQEHPEAVRWLRFLKEDHPELAVVAAGSFLELRLQDRGFSFPVGRVTFQALHPLSFFEFLGATGQAGVLERLLAAFHARRAPQAAFHDLALAALRDYLWVGGMPEAVASWVGEKSSAAVLRIQESILQAFAEDLQKYRGAQSSEYLEAAFDALPVHYGKRFKYENFVPGYKSRPMQTALGKLESAMVVSRVLPTSSLRPPLEVRRRSAAKLLPLDVGLAFHAMGGNLLDTRDGDLGDLLDGRLAEIFVGQQLLASLTGYPGKLHFWVREATHSNAEVDYLVGSSGGVLPIEVKSAASGALRSLHQFLQRSGRETGVRLYTGPFLDERQRVRMPEGELDYRLLSLPLYLAEALGRSPESLAGPN